MSKKIEQLHKVSEENMSYHEEDAVTGLYMIFKAQSIYRTCDLDGNGIKDFCRYLPQLWRAGSRESGTKNRKLIPEKIAFSRSSSDIGYIFESLNKIRIKHNKYKEPDSLSEWAAVAYPKALNITDSLTFITNQSNIIYAKKNVYYLNYYPAHPENDGWVKIKAESGGVKSYCED
jgi:hypothetical protein